MAEAPPAADGSPTPPAAVCGARPSLPRRWWRVLKTTAITAFVCWQLFFLLVRNPLDFWYKPIKKWFRDEDLWEQVKVGLDPVDDATTFYGDYTGTEQNWKMFTAPLARSASFLAARIEFTDGSSAEVLSENEPDPRSYFRCGGWRQRKLEDQLVFADPKQLTEETELPLWEAYARWSLRRWRAQHPDDPRRPRQIVLLRRRHALPTPQDDPSVFEEPAVYVVGRFDPDGRLAP